MEIAIFIALVVLVALVFLCSVALDRIVVAVEVYACRAVMISREEQDADGNEPQKKPNAMDEGFENIMSFSVGGKTGFESEE